MHKREQDEILITRNGLLTDTSIANIALFNGKEWHTPKHPLLKGVQRAALIDKHLIREKEITVDQLFNYSQICLFNAMIDFGKIKIDVNRTGWKKSERANTDITIINKFIFDLFEQNPF